MATMADQQARAPPTPLGVLRGHAAPVNCVQALHGSKAVSGAGDGSAKIWDLRTRRECASRAAHSAAGILQATRFGAARVLTQGRDGLVKAWDLESFGDAAREPIASWFCGCYSFTKAAVLRWGAEAGTSMDDWTQMVVCPSAEDRHILLFDARAPSSRESMTLTVETSDGKRGMCMSLALYCPHTGSADASSSYPCVAAGWEGGQFSVFDLRAGGKLAFEAQVTEKANPILAFDIAKDGRSAICGSSAEDLIRIELDYTTQTISSRPFFTCKHAGISAIRVRPDQRIFATAGWDHRIRIFHTRTLKPLAILKHHRESVFSVDFTDDNNFLLSASKDHTLALWSLYPPSGEAAKQALRTY